MKTWVLPTTAFFLGLGLGLSGPLVATQYFKPYMPNVFKKPLHPLEGIVTHKQRDQDRLLMTVTTQDGTILATFMKQVPEIDLLVEEQDSITLDVKQYEPFVNDPPVLKVNKQIPQTPIPRPETNSRPHSSVEEPLLQAPSLESPTLPGETSDTVKPPPPSTD